MDFHIFRKRSIKKNRRIWYSHLVLKDHPILSEAIYVKYVINRFQEKDHGVEFVGMNAVKNV